MSEPRPRLDYEIRGHRPTVTFKVGDYTFRFTVAAALALAEQVEKAAPTVGGMVPIILDDGAQRAEVAVPGAEAARIPAPLRSAIDYANGGEG